MAKALPFRRKKRKQSTEARARLLQIAADVYEDGDTEARLGNKIKLAIEEEPGRAWQSILLQLLVMLLPMLIKMFIKTT